VDENVDLLAFACADPASEPLLFERGPAGLAGRGEALRISSPGGDPAAAAHHAAEVLTSIESDDEVELPGTGPVAYGALPFVRGGPCELIVPKLVAGKSDDGTRWLTTIGDADEPVPDLDEILLGDGAARASSRQPREFSVTSLRPPEDWCDLVSRATKALTDDPDFIKVVLAREVAVSTDVPIDRHGWLERLRSAYPGCHVISIDGLVGASPELLVSRSGDVVRSHPMAGTAPRGGDPTTDQRLAASLLASTKDRAEHQITIDMVHDTLLNWTSYIDYEAQPSVVPVANVQHLATLVEGRLSHPAPSVLELVAALHPTPAVAGWPREQATAWIAEHEGMDRRRYAGTAGWADAQGNGTWAVSVRCAEVAGTDARVYAGNGIVADSDPATELAETRAKLQAMLSTLVRP
jgi:menaquinone-specific isochorismate synthase